MKVVWRRSTWLCIAVLAGACSNGIPAPDLAARIGDVELPYAEFEEYLRANSIEREVGLSSELLSGLFDRYLDERLLQTMAVRSGVPAGLSAHQAVERLLDEGAVAAVEDGEVAEYYRQHREEFLRAERVRLQQILVEERDVAENALAAVRGGTPFEDAARRYSNGPRAAAGGDQGELAHEDLPADLADTIFALPVGGVSEIVAAGYGYHIFKVTEKLPAVEPTLRELRPQIERTLRLRVLERETRRLIEDARRQYHVEIYVRNLPFNYSGRYV